MSPAKKKKDKRPIAVTIIAWAILILFLVRLYQAIDPLLATGVFETGRLGPIWQNDGLTDNGHLLLVSVAYGFFSISGIIVLVGFLKMQRWSWVVLITWTALSLITTLLDFTYDEPNYIVMASDVIIAFALNQSDVQRIFGIRRDNYGALR